MRELKYEYEMENAGCQVVPGYFSINFSTDMSFIWQYTEMQERFAIKYQSIKKINIPCL